MVSVSLLAAIGTPVVIMLIVLLILVIGSRSAISKLQKQVNLMKKNVDINSEAVDLMIPWVEAAQETFQLQGFGAY
tara:strand:- start:5529 stop:5756 length:228 start_codon:yes stop_codon:yes gene_type:complete